MSSREKSPYPIKCPRKFDRKQLPDKVLRSGAIESLISHNEDLMSRLQVTLRRISLLEEKLHKSNKFQSKLRFHYKNLKDQVLVLKEKEKYLRERKDTAQGKFDAMMEKISILEVEYARLYTSSQEKKIEFIETIKNLSHRNKRANKAKSRLSLIAHRLRDLFKKTKDELETLTKDFKGLQTKLGESTAYIQDQAQKFKEEKKALEQKNQQNTDEITQELKTLQKKVTQFDEIYDENVKLQNKLVFLQRKSTSNRDELNSEVSKLQESLVHYRSQAKGQALSIRNYNSEIEEKKP